MQGTCEGDTLTSMAVSLKQCSHECNTRTECQGFIYTFCDQRPFMSTACVLKTKMCRTPKITGARTIYAYFLIDTDGKLIYLCKL